jgi:hypothetical protein
MPIYHDETWALSLQANSSSGTKISAEFSAPVAEAAGVTLNADASAAFKRSVSQYWHFEKLDTYMVQPLDSYIDKSRKDNGVATYIKKNTVLGRCEVYMISGIVVARSGSMDRSSGQTQKLKAGGGAGAENVAKGDFQAKSSQENSISISAAKMSDFVWAIQIARVYKDSFLSDWEWVTLWEEGKPTGSTFAREDGREEERQRIQKALVANPKLADDVFGLESGDDVFLIVQREAGRLRAATRRRRNMTATQASKIQHDADG